MTLELAAAIIYFALVTFALIFTIAKVSGVEVESFPNRGRFYFGMICWVMSGILAIFVSFPGYPDWFVPIVYPILKLSLVSLFLAGFFLVVTTLISFPLNMEAFRKELTGRSDRIALLESIREIAQQPYPITELFNLVLKELGSFLVVKKGAVFLINPSRREMYLVAQIGLDREELGRMERFAMGPDIVSRAAAEQMSFVSGDLTSADSATRKLILGGKQNASSAAAVPLYVRDRSLGALLVLSEKPYRFEKRDRMLLSAAVEAVAGVVEANRLTRENQKIMRITEDLRSRYDGLRKALDNLTKGADLQELLKSYCRYITDKYSVHGCRVVKITGGSLSELASFNISAPGYSLSESYRVAVVDAVRRNKMVVLNQEARAKDGSTFVSKSTLLVPFGQHQTTAHALLVEAPANGLSLSDSFLTEIGGIVKTCAIAVRFRSLEEHELFNRQAVAALLNILKIKTSATEGAMLKHFADEVGRIMPEAASALIFVPDERDGYRIQESCRLDIELLQHVRFLPGEGPAGKAVNTGEVLEFSGINEVKKGWGDLETHNRDFFNRVFGEQGMPAYQINIPIRRLDEIAAVISIFVHDGSQKDNGREKGMLLLAAQLLSIKMSMAEMDDRLYRDVDTGAIEKSAHVLDRINNELATIIGRADLLERQSDVSGRTRYTTGEIRRAAEAAALSLKRLQEEMEPAVAPAPVTIDLHAEIEKILENRHVTGNLYMFENNRAVMLQSRFENRTSWTPPDPRLMLIIEKVLSVFVTFLDEGDEVSVTSAVKNQYFYMSLVRGGRDKRENFRPEACDFGSPDVLPENIVSSDMLAVLTAVGAEVSFDRFGRQPTYISMRFPLERDRAGSKEETMTLAANMNILAIDDQQMILDLLTGICRSLGLNLTTALTASGGLEIFNKEKPDLVMIDLAMQEMSGWEIARRIKDQSPETPVVLMTGWGIDVTPEEAARGGVDFTLAKPFKIEELTGVIQQARKKYISQ